MAKYAKWGGLRGDGVLRACPYWVTQAQTLRNNYFLGFLSFYLVTIMIVLLKGSSPIAELA